MREKIKERRLADVFTIDCRTQNQTFGQAFRPRPSGLQGKKGRREEPLHRWQVEGGSPPSSTNWLRRHEEPWLAEDVCRSQTCLRRCDPEKSRHQKDASGIVLPVSGTLLTQRAEQGFHFDFLPCPIFCFSVTRGTDAVYQPQRFFMTRRAGVAT